VSHEVNSWVERESNGLIKKLIPPKAVGKLTWLIFANAMHFKGAWKHKFHLLNGKRVDVIFMRSEKKEQFISTFDGFKVLRLSYKQGRDKKRRFSMYIFLPDAKDELPTLIEKLASESGYLKGKLPRRKVQVSNFKIPKFKISFTLEASNVLKELGSRIYKNGGVSLR
jgi:serpin B